jgi:hypothetical protein
MVALPTKATGKNGSISTLQTIPLERRLLGCSGHPNVQNPSFL